MSFKAIRDALMTEVEGVDVSEHLPEGWQFSRRYPIKQAPGYPGYFVTPTRNAPPVTIDSASQEVTYSFWIYLITSYQIPSDAEDQLTALADAILSHLLQRLKGTPLVGGVDMDGDVSGEWGFDPEYGERFYRIEINARVLHEIR